MAIVTTNEDGSISINRIQAFIEAMKGRSPFSIPDFHGFLGQIGNSVEQQNPNVTQGALNNARGEWYEAIIALGANEFARENGTARALVRLPNVNAFDCERLYQPEISNLIVELKKTLKESVDVSLISSNPDFVVVDASLLASRDTTAVSAADFDYLDKVFASLEGKCGFGQITAYCSVKSGLRPDRRLQIAHEGSLMKALYRHIQTRLWYIDAPGVRYFGIAGNCNDADRRALKTVATHSIVDVLGKPESAVDELFQVNTPDDLRRCLSRVLL